MKRINDTLFLEALKNQAVGSRLDAKAFYSSFLGGVTTEVHHMIVPLDDHMVHRGDAVFEAVKFVDGRIYALGRHLDRLDISAGNIFLKVPVSRSELEEIILETIRVSGLKTGLIRLFVARGPGGFTTNPYETTGAQIYCAITSLKPLPPERYQIGVKTGLSKVSVKEGFMARTKTCNYIPNVLMKKEALDRKIDFVVSVDEKGFIAEGSTENFAIIDHKGRLIVPSFDRILRGVTAVRALELANEIGIGGETRAFTESDVRLARGAVMLGTTIDILPVASFENHVFGVAVPEEARRLIEAFAKDISFGPLLVTV